MSVASHPIVVPRQAPRYVPRPVVVPMNLMHKDHHASIETPLAEAEVKQQENAGIYFFGGLLLFFLLAWLVGRVLPKEEDLADRVWKRSRGG